jgi:hypothetical protein
VVGSSILRERTGERRVIVGSRKLKHHDRLRRDAQGQLRNFKFVAVETRMLDNVRTAEHRHGVYGLGHEHGSLARIIFELLSCSGQPSLYWNHTLETSQVCALFVVGTKQ